MMNRYELTYIIDTALEETARKELIEKVSALIVANGGEIEKVDETWGKRRLAYAINYKVDGYYVLMNFEAEPDFVKELERNFNIDETIMRSMTIKLEYEAVKHEKPVIAEEVSFSSDDDEPAEAAPAVEAAPAEEAAPAGEEAAPAEAAEAKDAE